MTHKKYIVTIVVVVLVTITLIHVGYRLSSRTRTISHDIYSGSRGERLEKWNDMRRLKLTDDNISTFVNALLSKTTLPVPTRATEVSLDSMTESQKGDIREALMGFFRAYREDVPSPVYEYLAVSRGHTQFIPQVKESVLDAARQSGTPLASDADSEAFAFVWNMGSRGIGWEALLEKSGLCCFWETNAPLTPDQSVQMVLEDPALFGNTTSMPHLFTVSLRMQENLERGNKLLFCDVFFVAELNKAKDQDFCATGMRFWFDEAEMKWVPNMLVLVTPQVRKDLQFPF